MPQRLHAVILILSIILLIPAIGPLAVGQDAKHDREIAAAEFQENVVYLASDELEGRGSGSPGMAKAAAFIRATFKAAGLEPLFPDYLQAFPVKTGSRFGPGTVLNFSIHNEKTAGVLGDHFMPLSSGGEAVTGASAVFVGYGITAPEQGWDDYAGIDVTGKVAVILAQSPRNNDGAFFFDEGKRAAVGSIDAKILNARSHGAVGVIIFRGPREYDLPFPDPSRGYFVQDMGIPAMLVHFSDFQGVLSACGIDMHHVHDWIDLSFKPRSMPIVGLAVDIGVEESANKQDAWNVVGLLPGSDPVLKDEYVVVGAHYDHLGYGWGKSRDENLLAQIHNGADDNASGTSGLMEIAEWFGLAPEKPKRSIIFIAFGGEEMGLLGSTHFLNNCPVPREKIVAMLNMDMIGRLVDKKLLVSGVGTAAGFKPLAEKLNADFGFALSFDASGIASSDHAAFTVKKIPSFFFFSGIHEQYHKPSDDAALINNEDGAAIAAYAAAIARELANAPERPVYVEVEQGAPPVNRRTGDRPFFGSVPDFTWQGTGYRFQGITPGSPAEKAGLLPGDIMIRFGDAAVKNIYDYTNALGAYKIGDTVKVTVLREEKEVTVEVLLTKRGQ